MTLKDAIDSCLNSRKPTLLRLGHKRTFSAYSKCPCGSGTKFKWCCYSRNTGTPDERWAKAVMKSVMKRETK